MRFFISQVVSATTLASRPTPPSCTSGCAVGEPEIDGTVDAMRHGFPAAVDVAHGQAGFEGKDVHGAKRHQAEGGHGVAVGGGIEETGDDLVHGAVPAGGGDHRLALARAVRGNPAGAAGAIGDDDARGGREFGEQAAETGGLGAAGGRVVDEGNGMHGRGMVNPKAAMESGGSAERSLQ